MQLRSLYPLSILDAAHVKKKKKNQALSVCTTSISRSGTEEPGNEAIKYYGENLCTVVKTSVALK